MANMKIEKLLISNFKSILHLELSGFKRINLLIGRPNVGKSNIIEALSIFTIPQYKQSGFKKITDLIRVENESELFFEGNIEKPIIISTDMLNGGISFQKQEGLQIVLNNRLFKCNEKLEISNGRGEAENYGINRYIFSPQASLKKGFGHFLAPPFGSNLLAMIELFPKLRQELQDLFKEYQLQLIFDKASQSLKIMKQRENEVFLLPYHSVADTLQRVIFFKTAIVSNENNVLLLEEPEAHAFPPYISQITQEIIHSQHNQFFITTHSPFIVNDLLENAIEDLAIFMVDYQNQQTIVNTLTSEEIREIYRYGIDLFTNYETYL